VLALYSTETDWCSGTGVMVGSGSSNGVMVGSGSSNGDGGFR
jgi:hypothetical protein